MVHGPWSDPWSLYKIIHSVGFVICIIRLVYLEFKILSFLSWSILRDSHDPSNVIKWKYILEEFISTINEMEWGWDKKYFCTEKCLINLEKKVDGKVKGSKVVESSGILFLESWVISKTLWSNGNTERPFVCVISKKTLS